ATKPCQSDKDCKKFACRKPKVPKCINGFCKCVR
nr:Chain A, Nodule cysteine-rich protein 13 [Cicer arietinum]8ULM_A Chain A, Nodule cysteine-rich protein 13 [Cicer arietinum]